MRDGIIRALIFDFAVPNALTRQLPLHHADLQLTSLADMPLEALINPTGSSLLIIERLRSDDNPDTTKDEAQKVLIRYYFGKEKRPNFRSVWRA